MKRNLMLSLFIVMLAWAVTNSATSLQINDSTGKGFTVGSWNSECGKWGWEYNYYTVPAGGSISLCSGNQVEAWLVIDEKKSLSDLDLPIFVERGRPVFSYQVTVPTAANWIVDVKTIEKAFDAPIAGEGYVTRTSGTQKGKIKKPVR